ncbi:MAG: aldose epimerase family protein [Kiritimatiellia bacterium]|jgi:aldose 1-epimerase|nr:aldose epimerase family protein [Kiritimatiellia bacterium]MDP6629369.1 aldose epimerase family protein [Kiritimatiellia bacterium]MDP6811352.1 aldose epimerase family protein [Kiritimatiellia bacterium]MDP7024393.1 aldose epimerase family protein [Kiritimatiellia bacterium]
MSTLSTRSFGSLDGQEVTLFTLQNRAGVEVAIMNYGATIQSIRTPDRDGNFADITLGFDTFEEYLAEANPYFGAVCGRVANRIDGAQFTLEGIDYTLAANDGANSLHGGLKGFDKVVWKAETVDDGVCFRMRSPDGDEGYPGTLDISLVYTLSEDSTLSLHYEATTDATTILNLTNHAYFNLAGHAAGKVLDHVVTIAADTTTPSDPDTLILSGEIASVDGSPMDLRVPTRLGDRFEALPRGYDNNFILGESSGPVVRVTEPTSGRTIEMETSEPAVQLYTGFFMEDMTGKDGATYGRFGGLCLEAQHYPDSIHHPNFPTTVLHPNETYTQHTSYRFGTA